MPKCSYCSKEYSIPRGLTLVLKDGTAKHLCSSKCRKNFAMKRRKVRWITKTKKEKVVETPKEEKVEKIKEKPAEEKKE
jgi:ribosomal protein L24E